MKLLKMTVVGAAAGAIVLSACGETSNDSTAGYDVTCDIPAENIDDTALDMDHLDGEITFMTRGLKADYVEYLGYVIESFIEENPETKINVIDLPADQDVNTVLLTQAEHCMMADVVQVPAPTVLELSTNGYLVDLDLKFPGFEDKFLPGIDMDTAVPWYFNPTTMAYNEDIAREAGLDPDSPPGTMDEYFEFAETITAATDHYAVHGNIAQTLLPQWRAAGVTMMNDDTTEFAFATDGKALEWVTAMANLYELGGIPENSVSESADVAEAYAHGDLAYGPADAFALRAIESAAPKVYEVTGVAAQPTNGDVGPLFDGQFLAISSATPNIELALAFTDYLTNADNGVAWATFGMDNDIETGIPANPEALEHRRLSRGSGNDPLEQALIAAAAEAKGAETSAATFYLTPEMHEVLVTHINRAIVGDVSPQEALDTAQAEMNDLLGDSIGF